MKKLWNKQDTSGKVFVIASLILLVDAPFVLFSKFGSQGDRVSGFVLGVVLALYVVCVFFNLSPRSHNKEA